MIQSSFVLCQATDGSSAVFEVLPALLLLVFGGITTALYRRNARVELKQGCMAAIGSGICIMYLFYPWITYNGTIYTGMGIRSLSSFAITQVIVFSLLLLSMLLFLGAFLHGYGFEVGEWLISRSSNVFLGLSILLILGMGVLPGFRFEGFAPWLTILGALVVKISVRLPKEEEEEGPELISISDDVSE